MKFVHENLEIWQLAVDLTSDIYQVTRAFPKEELFGLMSQIRRAIVSVALNITEGSGRHSKKDFANFINYSITSLQETDTGLKIALKLKYITDDDYQKISPKIEKLYFKMIGFYKKLKKS